MDSNINDNQFVATSNGGTNKQTMIQFFWGASGCPLMTKPHCRWIIRWMSEECLQNCHQRRSVNQEKYLWLFLGWPSLLKAADDVVFLCFRDARMCWRCVACQETPADDTNCWRDTCVGKLISCFNLFVIPVWVN